ncbi:uncharacterized protein LOC131292787, partial [Anopheles ziemanni]|uniref:uncharacterized protein LOC131271137 n=1 Tax=Anopheles coustani TaxID=139045 RepID=UPI0026591848
MPAEPIILSSRRAILLVSLSRYESFVRDFQQDRDLVEVEARISKFERLCEDLEKLQQELEDGATTEEEVKQNEALRADFEPRLIRVEAELKAKRPSQGSSFNATGNSLAGIKLPTISLPQFHGDYMEWLTFRDTFECLIHDNRDLPAIQKFHYLRAAIKGEAAQVIEAITISAANYEIAWQALTARYSNEYLLKKRHLQALFTMTPAKRETATALHLLVDEFERHKKTLDHLGERTDTWGVLLEHLLCTKLPTSTLRDWEEHASNEESPTYASLIVFLQRRMRVLETLSVNKEQDDHSAGTFSTAMPAASIGPATNDHTANLQRTFAAAMERAPTQVLLQTAIINIVDSFGLVHPARALLDSASQPDMISSQLAHRLRLKRKKVNVMLQGAGQSTRPLKESVHAKIASRTKQFEVGVEFLIVDKLMANLPLRDVNTTSWNIPSELILADPEFYKSSAIDIILGARHYAAFFEGSAQLKLAPTLPTLQESVFGWVVTGSIGSPEPSEGTSNVAHTTAVICMTTLEESIERFWKSEELWFNDGYSPEERQCEAIYRNTTQRDPSGRYIVRLPKQPDFFDKLGLSRDMALHRFILLERRLQRDPDLKEEYHKFMKEYLELGHMTPTSPADNDHGYYLPHHPVLKESSTTTKLRVVFDGSAKTSTGYSLNDALRVGPVVQDQLLDIILRFRTYKVALVGDIAKMYRQIEVHPDDRRFQRVLFRFSPDASVETYELNTVTYGLAPSSFLATRTLLQLAEDEGTNFPHAAQALVQNFYVDDFIGGADSEEQAKQLREELDELLKKGGFSLRKWTSSKLAVLSGLTEDQIGTQSTLQFMPDEKIKALGIAWEPEADVLSFESRIDADTSYPTMRLIFSGISRMFDPIGLISPIIIRAKLLMQELWVQKPGWDNPVSDSIYKKWTSIKSDWPIISGYKSDRYALLPDSRVQLHTFCDASEAAFGACIYSRCENKQGHVRISLLASKSRLAPLKRVTLPRLELNAAVTGAHLYDRVKQAMGLESAESYFWSDSTVTLHWLSSPPNNWKTYVGNRVAEVQAYSHLHPWKHIAGCSNPADLVSRGVTAADFVKSALWSSGPEWLIRPASEWPNSTPTVADGAELEIRQVSAAVAVIETVHPWFERYSSYTKLLRVIGYCLRFVRNAKEKCRTRRDPLEPPASSTITPDLMEAAKTVLCKLAQQDAFPTELERLRKREVVPKRSPLRRLSPFIDSEGVMRVGGRLKLSQLPYQSKHPILLPKKHIFARRIAEHLHRELIHGGGRLLLSQIREEFWPLDGRHLVKSVVRHCLRCIRQQPILAQQQIGQLPSSRITPNRPFATIGVDYAGPIYLRPIHKRAEPAKAYLCVFVCFATKAVHLELVGDLTTAGFLASLRRFASRRGRPSHIYSDNGKNFEGAARELSELFEMLHDQEQSNIIVSTCADMGITWHFSPPRAPHFGGLWEAAVKTAKRHLFRQLGSTRLPYEGYITVLHQIEAAMNSRPLLPMSDDPNDLAALTPAHFLIGTSMNAIPEPDYSNRKTYTLSEWQKWQLLVQRFWKHWASEYLQEMQRDTMKTCSNSDFAPGRLAILMDEALPTTQWPLARIVETHPGTDSLTRV